MTGMVYSETGLQKYTACYYNDRLHSITRHLSVTCGKSADFSVPYMTGKNRYKYRI